MYCTKGSRRTLTLTCFGVMTEPPDLPYREDVLVENGTAAPKSCLLSLEMRTTTAAGGLLPTGEISTATNTTFNKSPLRLYSTEETNSKEKYLWPSVLSVWYDSSFQKLLAVPSCQRVIETKFCQKVIETKSMQDRRSIQAVFKVVSVPSRFWDRGARCFVGGSC